MNSYNNIYNNICKITLFALPISASMLVNMIAGFVAMAMVAKLGKEQLAAGALAVPTFTTILTVFATIFYALGILISHYKSQQKTSVEIGILIKNGFCLALLLAVPANLALWNINKILILFKQDPALVALTINYFRFAGLTMIPSLIGSVLAQVFMGIGRPRFMMLVSLITLPATILLSYGLVLGHFGLPQMALSGISCASFVIQSMACFGIFIYIYYKSDMREYALFTKPFVPSFMLCKTIFVLGIPIGIQFGAELAALAVSTYFMGHFGVIALAASQISSQYAVLVVMVSLGLSQAVSILISEAYGKKNLFLVKNYITASVIILLIFFAVVLAIFLLAPTYLIRVFVDSDNMNNMTLIHLAIQLIAVLGLVQLIDGIRNLLSGGLRGLHNSKSPMHIGVGCIWLISLPMCYFVAFKLHGGPVGLRIGFMTGFIVAVILLGLKLKGAIAKASNH